MAPPTQGIEHLFAIGVVAASPRPEEPATSGIPARVSVAGFVGTLVVMTEPSWHDREVARAADAWLTEPRDTQAYARLVDAVLRRRAFLNPPLLSERGEVTDDLGADRTPVAIGELVRHLGAQLARPDTAPPPQDAAG